MKILLEVEKRNPVHVDKFSRVEKALRILKSYGPSSFASLTKPDGSYLQVAGGRMTCVVEQRLALAGNHYRAYLQKPRVPFEGAQTLMFGGGHMRMEQDEILFIDDVVPVFEAFFNSIPLPSNILWRDMSNLFVAPN